MAVATVAEATAASSSTQTDGDAIFNSDLALVIGHRKKSVAYEFIKNPEEIEYLYLERYLTGSLALSTLLFACQ